MRHYSPLAIAAAFLFAVPVLADTFVESFDGPPEGHWICNGFSRIEPTGGNPGAFFYGYGIDSIFPRVGTTTGAGGRFVGDYRARQVNSLGADAKLLRVDFPNVGDRPMTLLLITDNGTPGNLDDDWAAFTRGANIPYLGDGWLSYDYTIPYADPTLPAGWTAFPLGLSPPPVMDWNALITHVSDVNFWWGDPELFYIFQTWDMGMDNMRISTVPEPTSLGLFFLVAWLRRR